ncbi:MAG: two-component regulator propeller domain-containing protein, partial [Bacteroidota bacterium]
YNRKTGEVEHFSTRLAGNHHITNDFVHVIFCDENRNIWIGTRDGIHVFDKKNRKFIGFREFFHNNKLPDFKGMRICMIIRGRDNSYWIATQNGLFRINPSRTSGEVFTVDLQGHHKIGGNLIYCIREDRLGSIWIATINGLDVYNPQSGKMTHFRKSESKNSLVDNFVISLCEDDHGDMWIGTGSYVNRFVRKDSAFIYYSKENGLPKNNIFEILKDNRNTLWFATGGGLCKFDTATGTFRNYTVDEGLQSAEFNLRACYNSPDGEVFFGGMNGFNSFYPDQLKDNPNVPEIMITGCYKLTKNGKEFIHMARSGEVVLPYSDQAFTVEFVALEFTNPEKNQYSYMLEGLSKEWINIGNRRFVPFSNMSPGEYIFKVKGSNNDGIWNQTGCSLKIVILPPWWRSWWALTAYALLIAGGIVTFVRIREKKLVLERNLLEKKVVERTLQIEKINLEILQKNEALNHLNSELKTLNATKDKFFSIIAHDLRNPFNSILGLTDIVLGNLDNPDTAKIRKTVGDIRDASRHAYDLLQNLLIWARSQTGNLDFQPISFELM